MLGKRGSRPYLGASRPPRAATVHEYTMPAEAEVEIETDVDTAPPREGPAARPDADPDAQTKRQPPYAVILHNDRINGFDFVVASLRKVFGYGTAKCFMLTLRAHAGGRSLVWTGMKEHAEFKAERLKSRGPDPAMKSRGAKPLKVTIEPMPS